MDRLVALIRVLVLGVLVLLTGYLVTLLVMVLTRPLGMFGGVEIMIVWALATWGSYLLWRRVFIGPKREGKVSGRPAK